MRVKVGILGHFGEGANLLNGQTVKTKIITEELHNQLGQDQVLKIDTHGGWKTLLKAPFQVFHALKNSTNVLIFPAHNGLRVYAPLLSLARRFFKKRKIHYVVIGGWLPQFLIQRKCLARILKKFDGIYVETNAMRLALKAQGFENVFVMPNCKELRPLSPNELIYQTEAPFKLCTFSRVMKEKGIEEAIEAVKAINQKTGETVYKLDIYGQVDPAQIEWFDKLRADFPEYVTYGGLVPFDKSVEVLKNYFVLLFPTYYEGEGFAGTVLDALSAGVPVIASDWKYNSEIISEDVGYLCETQNIGSMITILSEIMTNPDKANSKKMICLKKSLEYKPEIVVKVLIDSLS